MCKMIHCLLVISLAILLNGCVNLGPHKHPPEGVFTLTQVNPPYSVKARKTHLTLLINDPKSSPGYGTQSMMYVDRHYQLKEFANNHWIDTPGRMLTPLLTQSLQNTQH